MGQKATKRVLCGRLIDPSSQKVVENGCVVVDETEGIIVDVGTRGGVEAPGDVDEPELPSNATIMPGLIDAHIHITGLRSRGLHQRASHNALRNASSEEYTGP